MGLKLRKRKDDPKVVEDLFALHAVLNDNGKHWIKGYMRKRRDGVTCRCLLGGIHSVTPRSGSNRRGNLVSVIEQGIRASSGSWWSITGFNDYPGTTWRDVEAVIRAAIEDRRVRGN